MKKKSIGIDISKKTFDVCILTENETKFYKYQYEQKQMQAFVKEMKKLSEHSEVRITTENTGIYHLKLVTLLIKNDLLVAVVNALKIKRFSQMKMYRTKTDKADAKIIAMYGAEQKFKAYKLKDEKIAKIRQYIDQIEDFIQIRGQIKNRLEGLDNLPNCPELCKELFNKDIDNINENIRLLEKEIDELIKNNYQKESQRLKSVPGVGQRVSTAMIAHFGKFENFQKAKQVISFLGFEPAVRQSGTSINGHARISKKGNRYLRKVLYMAAMSAYRFNPYCKELFDRLIQKGKSFKTAIIAVANKLIRQMFAIIKNGTSFDANYLKS